MVALTIIADPFPDWEALLHEAAVRDLAKAVAATAPRSCSVRYVRAKDSVNPGFTSPLISTVEVPSSKRMLPILWQTGAAARPLDGEFVHSMTPLAPLRSNAGELGSQSSVMVPNSISWTHPELMQSGQARLYRRLIRRAAKYADVLLAPTHAAAAALLSQFGGIPVQVLPLAAPTELLEPNDAAIRRADLELPGRYFVTTAADHEEARLDWAIRGIQVNPELPSLVVIEGYDALPPKFEPEQNTSHDRVVRVKPRDLADIGAIISGAELLLAPQAYEDTGYAMLAALAAGVPVLHAGLPTSEELVLDAGVAADDATLFADEITRIILTEGELGRLRVLARDRARAFGWHNTAWQLWEIHANL